jgi:hypothetical protein
MPKVNGRMRGRRGGRNAGLGRGGMGTLLVGFLLAVAGGYLVTNQVEVGAGPFGGFAWFGPNSFGLLLVPLLVGVGILCFNPKLLVGRLLTAGGAVILLASVLDTLRITFRQTSQFNTLLMLGLLVIGLGLMARSVVGTGSDPQEDDHEVDVRESLRSDAYLPRGHTRRLASAPTEPGTDSAKSVEEELAEIRAKKAQPNTSSSPD